MRGGAVVYQPVNVGLFGESHVDYSAALASYSADTIGMSGTVRKPLRMDGAEWVCVGSSGRGYQPYMCSSISVYKLVAAAEFAGVAVTYAERVAEAHAGGDRVRGVFYHGMKVRAGGRSMVLVGPETELVSGDPVVVNRYADEDEDEGARDPRNDRSDDDEDEDWELEAEDEDDDDYGARDPRNDRSDDDEDEDEQLGFDSFADDARIAGGCQGEVGTRAAAHDPKQITLF